jgi:glycerol uptake facilitator-like aquaporin
MAGDLARKLAAEALGSLMLAGAVVGSGIMAARLTSDPALALIANTGATGAVLYVLVSALAPISGAHFNPAVTLVMALRGEIKAALACAYMLVQVCGCILGVWLAHAMFTLPIVQISTHARSGAAQVLSEAVATFALVFAILMVSRWRPQAVAAAVALVICAGYWWTASTSFANPAITIARALSDTFAGVRPADAPGFVAGQTAGALAAWLACALIAPKSAATSQL